MVWFEVGLITIVRIGVYVQGIGGILIQDRQRIVQ